MVEGVVADFLDPDRVRGLLHDLGELDIVVNDVGAFERTSFADIVDDDWQRYFDVNVMSGVRVSRHALPGMLARDGAASSSSAASRA